MYFSKYERRYNNIAHSHIWEHIIALHILRRRSEQSLTHLVCYKVKDSFGDDKRYCWRFMMREKKSESDKINFANCKHEPPNDRGRYFYSFYYYHVSCVILLAMATLWEETLNLAPLLAGRRSSCNVSMIHVAISPSEPATPAKKKVSTDGLHPHHLRHRSSMKLEQPNQDVAIPTARSSLLQAKPGCLCTRREHLYLQCYFGLV